MQDITMCQACRRTSFCEQETIVMTREQNLMTYPYLHLFGNNIHMQECYCRLPWPQIFAKRPLSMSLATGAPNECQIVCQFWNNYCMQNVYLHVTFVCLILLQLSFTNRALMHQKLTVAMSHCLEFFFFVPCAWRMLPSATKTCWSRAMVWSTQTICKQKQESGVQGEMPCYIYLQAVHSLCSGDNTAWIKQSRIFLKMVCEVAHILGTEDVAPLVCGEA